MKPVCTACGGPLFRSHCFGLCANPRRRAFTPSVFDSPRVTGNGYSLEWVQTFQSEVGHPLDVARWIAESVTPLGYRLRVWPALRRAA